MSSDGAGRIKTCKRDAIAFKSPSRPDQLTGNGRERAGQTNALSGEKGRRGRSGKKQLWSRWCESGWRLVVGFVSCRDACSGPSRAMQQVARTRGPLLTVALALQVGLGGAQPTNPAAQWRYHCFASAPHWAVPSRRSLSGFPPRALNAFRPASSDLSAIAGATRHFGRFLHASWSIARRRSLLVVRRNANQSIDVCMYPALNWSTRV